MNWDRKLPEYSSEISLKPFALGEFSTEISEETLQNKFRMALDRNSIKVISSKLTAGTLTEF